MRDPSRGLLWPTTTPTPDTLLDYWLPRLTGAQLRALLFLVRETYGFRRPDAMVGLSIPQFLHGKRRDDRQVCGCGLKSKTSLRRALHELEGLALVYRHRPEGGEPADTSCSYRLLVARHPVTPESEGFRPLSSTALPDAIFDIWLERLSDAELRVLLYISRHTLGWRKEIDVIGIAQFTHGIRTKDGRIVDEGCGVKTEKFIYQALNGLEEYGLITRLRRYRKDGGHLTTAYSLRFSGDRPSLPPRPTRATPGEALLSDSRRAWPPETREEMPIREGTVTTGEGGQFAREQGGIFNRTPLPITTGEGSHSRPDSTVIDNVIGGQRQRDDNIHADNKHTINKHRINKHRDNRCALRTARLWTRKRRLPPPRAIRAIRLPR
jgi:hypothetical protein